MKLFRISQDESNGYDTYDSAVVAAKNEEAARHIHPGTFGWGGNRFYLDWASKPENVKVEYIGNAKKGTKEGVILASFNAG